VPQYFCRRTRFSLQAGMGFGAGHEEGRGDNCTFGDDLGGVGQTQ
jgi:hypothetical protein